MLSFFKICSPSFSFRHALILSFTDMLSFFQTCSHSYRHDLILSDMLSSYSYRHALILSDMLSFFQLQTCSHSFSFRHVLIPIDMLPFFQFQTCSPSYIHYLKSNKCIDKYSACLDFVCTWFAFILCEN